MVTGQLLAAVGIDANDNMYPIAYAAVEIENKDTWCWFLQILIDDLGPIHEHGWTFISDQQKVNSMFPFKLCKYSGLFNLY